jgi:hypothetical protein
MLYEAVMCLSSLYHSPSLTQVIKVKNIPNGKDEFTVASGVTVHFYKTLVMGEKGGYPLEATKATLANVMVLN